MNFPKSFFCSNCGAIQLVYYSDLRSEKWREIMLYIAEKNPNSKQIAEKYDFTRRMAQIYLKEFKEMTRRLILNSLRSTSGT